MQPPLPYHQDVLHDYRLILDTPPVVKQKIAVLKTHFDKDYKGMVIAGGSPFIYLATFSQIELKEEVMIDHLYKMALGLMPFKLHIKDFGCLGENEIYIALKEQPAVGRIVNLLKTVENQMVNARFNDLPRITIAQHLMPWQFKKSWPLLAEKRFSATFISDKMLLLKRMYGFRGWQVLKHLNFENQLVY